MARRKCDFVNRSMQHSEELFYFSIIRNLKGTDKKIFCESILVTSLVGIAHNKFSF